MIKKEKLKMQIKKSVSNNRIPRDFHAKGLEARINCADGIYMAALIKDNRQLAYVECPDELWMDSVKNSLDKFSNDIYECFLNGGEYKVIRDGNSYRIMTKIDP